MADKISLETTTNAKAIEDSLARVADHLREKIAIKALKSAQEPVLEQARANLSKSVKPGGTGNLLDSLTVKVWTPRGGNKTTAMVGALWPIGAHLHLVEFGHEASGWYAGGDRVPGKEFLAPAVDAHKGRQESILIAEIKKGVERAIKSGGAK